MRTQILILIMTWVSVVSAQKYKTVHTDAIVVDMHTDVLLNVMRGADISKRLDYGQFDLVRMQEGGIDVQFFAIWPDPRRYLPDRMYDHSMYMIGLLEQIVEKNDNLIELAVSVPDIRRIVSAGKMAACIGLEGGTAIENDLEKLREFYRRGVRYMGLTWNDSPDWAMSAKDESENKFPGRPGLAGFGRQVIATMNELGMMIDVSHCSEATFYDVIKISQRPVIASHSAVFKLRWHYRNLKDEQIKAIAAGGGVVFVNFYPGYLDYEFARKYENIINDSKSYLDSLRIVYGDDFLGYRKFRNRYYSEQTASIRIKTEKLFEHIDYIVQLVGDDHVGLGSDFDGISITPAGLEDVSKMPNLTHTMLVKGYSEQRIRKILGGNFLRVFEEVTR